ncbi:MAG: helix-turn-helix domain-containing protein [Clostridiales bacterium]|jgi:transcriptional regulator with XRE-family HTH domain|nr:helix-turn-helix domain-containing protein [Clostridiales bacterium]
MFANNLKNLLIERKLSQKDLAERLGVKQNTVSDWINQGNSPKLERLCRISDYFLISLDRLIKGADEEYSPSPSPEETAELRRYFDRLLAFKRGKVVGYAQLLADTEAKD